jgi:hypothetical protein
MESYRENGKVKRRYHGRGEAAIHAEREALLRRMRRQNAREDAMAEKARFLAKEAFFAEYFERVDRAMREALQNAGYHLHARGTWRKMRHRPAPLPESYIESIIPTMTTNPERTEYVTDHVPSLPAVPNEGGEPEPFEVPQSKEERAEIILAAMLGDGDDAEGKALLCIREHPDEASSAAQPFIEEAIEHVNPTGTRAMHRILGYYVASEIAGNLPPDPLPVERMLVERVVICKMDLAAAHRLARTADSSTAVRESITLRRIDSAHRRHALAINSLATWRRLNPRRPTMQQRFAHIPAARVERLVLAEEEQTFSNLEHSAGLSSSPS